MKLRASLAGIEAKEAGGKYGGAAAMVAGALFVAILGYVFLIVCIVFGIAAAFESRHAWIWIMGGAAFLHLGGAAALFFLARKRVKGGAFPATMEELKKDELWLKNLASQK
jgi:uncharacterized membrane protein YqjE